MSFLKRFAHPFFLLLTVLTGLIILSPHMHFQEFLSQGDHGRDLYAAQAVYRGELPYRDFWWVYGPLMPYYYGLFFKAFGVNITSIILGKIGLKLLAGIFMYLAARVITSPFTAFLAACWFMIFHQDFFFTYNHIGGIAMILAVTHALLSYIRAPRLAWAYRALGYIFILGLIKINFAAAALGVTLITVAVIDWLQRSPCHFPKKIFYTTAIIGVPALLYIIYWSLLNNLTAMDIRQCLPYLGDDQPYNTSPWIALHNFIEITVKNMTSNWMNFSFGIILLSSLARTIYLLLQNQRPLAQRVNLALMLGMLAIFYVANFHEFLKSGVWYRAYWAQPLSMILSFALIETATTHARQAVRICTLSFITFIAAISWQSILPRLATAQKPTQFLSMEHGGIYVSNQPAWIETVTQTTAFLKKTLAVDELFFALPYDCLYYYLTDKKSPTRQLIFFEHIKVPPEQERAVIAELEKNHVNFVLMSSRAHARQEKGLGMFGETYCPLIGAYIKEHFTPIARFGDWTNEPGWAWNHGTVIMKRTGT